MISHLTNENVPPLYIAQLSGHKNLKSLESYAKASDDQQKQMSLAISRKQPLTDFAQSLWKAPRSAHHDITSSQFHSSAASNIGLFAGATFSGTVNVNFYKTPPKRRARAFIDSDSDSD